MSHFELGEKAMSRKLLVVRAIAVSAAVTACAEPDGTVGTADTSSGDTSTGGWQQPITPWGEPDIQGTWPISHLIGTPLQRPAEYGERRLMTDEEFEQTLARVEERNTRYDEEQASNKMGGGHWAEPTEALRLTSLIVDPPNGRLPELTALGKELAPKMGSDWNRTVFDTVNDFDSWNRCISRGMPVTMLPRNYNNGILIKQTPGYVVITTEMVHEARIIPTTPRAPLDPAIKQWLGEPRGRWEGNVLVVESTNFNGLFGMTNFGVPGSPRDPTPTTVNLKITERFEHVSEDAMNYSVRIEDPAVIVQPWTIEYPMQLDNDYQIFEYACHEDNTSVRNYIVTSRYERAQQAAGDR
jgi:hypothetical protein